MKTCPVCALEVDDGYFFCPEDGSSLPSQERTDLMRGVGNLVDERHEFGASDESPNPVVLYCPTCAAEYPLTFSACPVHEVQLVKHAIPKMLAVESKPQQDISRPTMITPTDIEQEVEVVEGNANESALDHEEAGEQFAQQQSLPPESQEIPHDDAVVSEMPMFAQDRSNNTEGFRLAAVATVVVLVLISVVALYMVFSKMNRRRTATEARVANITEVALPFIATPKEAQDYVEEQPAPVAAPIEAHSPTVEKKIAEPPALQPTNRASVTRPQSMPAPDPPASRMNSVSNPALPPLPRGESAGFDARLVRVRGLRTASGYRYDLTFNMQEQSGRSAQWQRILITTRSASGAAHTQAIPFVHRLGATGALTFTVGVELAGRTQADWRAHVVCTTLGWDNQDRPLQASFAANVTP
jgi:hypothetical protein